MENDSVGRFNFSAVIPARNEVAYLPRLLDSIDRARSRYAGTVEVIVSDNDSTDGTAELALLRGCKLARTEMRSIAAVRNAGAQLAHGELLSFVDADSIVHPETFCAAAEFMSRPDHILGASGFCYDRMSAGIRLSYWVSNGLTDLLGVAGGGGCLVCRRKDFDSIGGFRESMLKSEDVMFVIDLKRLGRSRGQKFAKIPGIQAINSARKFDRYGDWHQFSLLGKAVLAAVLPGRKVDDVVRAYWYSDAK